MPFGATPGMREILLVRVSPVAGGGGGGAVTAASDVTDSDGRRDGGFAIRVAPPKIMLVGRSRSVANTRRAPVTGGLVAAAAVLRGAVRMDDAEESIILLGRDDGGPAMLGRAEGAALILGRRVGTGTATLGREVDGASLDTGGKRDEVGGLIGAGGGALVVYTRFCAAVGGATGTRRAPILGRMAGAETASRVATGSRRGRGDTDWMFCIDVVLTFNLTVGESAATVEDERALSAGEA